MCNIEHGDLSNDKLESLGNKENWFEKHFNLMLVFYCLFALFILVILVSKIL